MTKDFGVILVILLVFHHLYEVASLTTTAEYPDVNNSHGGITYTYTRDELLQHSGGPDKLFDLIELPDDIKKRQHKRGRRGGVRARCRRRGTRIPMPMIVSGNVRSLRNKTDELTGLTRWNYAYRESSVICLTETWLQDKDPDSAYSLDGFTLVRGDRTAASGKTVGGGVCVYINNRWCQNISAYDQCCNPDIEYLTVSLRPYYLPREFNKVYITIAYIPPSADVKNAENILHDAVCKMENSHPDAVNIITGDFNECKFDKYIPNFQQYIHFPTRSDKMLDPLFCNIKNAFTAKKLCPLGVSDHNMCHLIPMYRQKFKSQKPEKRLVYRWNENVNETLLGCMECTDFEVLYDANVNAEQNVDVLNEYLKFCVDLIVPKKVVRCYPNNKPWVTKDLKYLLNKKKRLLGTNEREDLKIVQKEINTKISVCKKEYKNKIENMFKTDSKTAWKGLKVLTGMNKNQVIPDVENAQALCNELNTFYARFDKQDFTTVRIHIINFLKSRDAEPITITEEDVLRSLKLLKIGKAAGPDGIGSSIVKLCREPLAPVLCKIFQKSINETHIPKIWKTSELVPAPKKNPPTCNNDYRPIALTAIMMKCLEKIVKNMVTQQVKPHIDNFQFAYTVNRCVEDATLSLTDFVLSHVDKASKSSKKNFVKILYVDFSSAFNTIQPHIMMQKLINMNVNPKLILWINEFLTDRPQYVKLLEAKSGTLITNTGAPQGCVLSPLLFTIYTSDCKCDDDRCRLFKYADDTALIAKCTNEDVVYRENVKMFTEWCKNNYLELNVKKTKEMVVDFRSSQYVHPPLYINDELVECVTEYKYLGTIIDQNFTFNLNVQSVYKKANSRLYFIRKLCKLRVDNKILELFYSSIVQSVISFSIICWYGNCSMASKQKVTRIIRNCSRLGVKKVVSLEDLFRKSTLQRCNVIMNDTQHPLHMHYNKLPSGRRLRSIKTRTARYANSFVPSSVRLLNNCR